MSAYANGFGKIADRGRIAPFWEKRPYRRVQPTTTEVGESNKCSLSHSTALKCGGNMEILCRFRAGS